MKKFPIKFKIVINYKLFKKFNKSKLHIHKDTYNVARHKVKEIVFNENCTFSEKKTKPRDLWKVLKHVELPQIFPVCEFSSMKIKMFFNCTLLLP